MGTIHSVDKMWSRNASDASTSDRGRKFDISFREAYQVFCTPDTTLLEVYQAPGIPAANSIYPGTSNVYCLSASPQQISPVYYIVDVAYAGEFGPGGPNDNPLNALPLINWTDAETDEPIDVDFDNKAICTINGEPIEGITTKIADQVVTIQRNFASFSPSATAAYRRSVSSDQFMGYAAGTAKMISFSAQQILSTGAGYWDVTASIQFRLPYRTTADKAWFARVLNQGFYEKVTVASGTRIKRAEDGNGEPVVKPVLLKADGTRETDPANATFLEFRRYGALPYNSLGLL